MPKNPNLGNRFVCFRCGTKFYDLNRSPSLCPDCGADQADAPSLNPTKRARATKPAPEEDTAPVKASEEEEEEEEGMSLLKMLDSTEETDGGED